MYCCFFLIVYKIEILESACRCRFFVFLIVVYFFLFFYNISVCERVSVCGHVFFVSLARSFAYTNSTTLLEGRPFFCGVCQQTTTTADDMIVGVVLLTLVLIINAVVFVFCIILVVDDDECIKCTLLYVENDVFCSPCY